MRVIKWPYNKIKSNDISPIKKQKIILSNKIDKSFNSTVRYGNFKGLRLSSETWWGVADRASILLGLYEKEVLESLANIPSRHQYFIDLGAANGYYGIGVLISGICKKSYCYEISEHGREVIKLNSQLNNVEESVILRGKANLNFYKEIPENEIDNSILFVDIEGGEFDIFDNETFKSFGKAIIFIELHDWFFVDGSHKLDQLKKMAFKTHKITELKMGARDLSIYKELEKFCDDDRWLICSEGRGQLMTWLRLDPKTII
jgi:hypothetical protein